MSEPEYRVYALRYAMRDAKRTEHFIGGDPHDAPMPMDYFVWAAVNEDRAVIIDTGFTAEVAAKRKRKEARDLKRRFNDLCGEVTITKISEV